LSALDFIGTGQELIFALGESELRATVGEDQQIIFDNLEYLAELDVEDFLSLRLYSNNDVANVLWEWAFLLNLEFIDKTNHKITGNIAASNPKPVVHLGHNFEMDLFTVNDIVTTFGTNATLQINGKVYCDIADIIEGGKGNIPEITITVPRPNSTGGVQVYTIALNNLSTTPLSEIRPNHDDEVALTIADEAHSFIGYFQTTVSIELTSGSQEIIVEAKNAIGNTGVGSITIDTEVLPQGYNVTNVRNDDRTQLDRGVFNPFWLKLEDSELTAQNYTTKFVTFLDTEHPIIPHQDKMFYVDKPFLFVTKPVLLTDVTNIRDSLNSPSAAIANYTSQAGLKPHNKLLSANYMTAPSLFGDEWQANNFSYAGGSTIQVFWANDRIKQGWTIDEDSLVVYEKHSSAWVPDWYLDKFYPVVGDDDRINFADYQIDDDVSIEKVNVKPEKHGKSVVQFVVKLKKSAIEHKEKRIVIKLTKTEGGEEQIEYADALFYVKPLKTVILAVDGLGYSTANSLINIPDSNFNQLFGNGKAIGNDTPALSALPTITWANWPGVFSGGPPSQHGWLGNSYFPRESTHHSVIAGGLRYPIFSAGKSTISAESFGLSIDAQQQIGVALGGVPPSLSLEWIVKESVSLVGAPVRILVNDNLEHAYSMDDRSTTQANSLYDLVADELGRTNAQPLNVRSIKVFYDRAGGNVAKQSVYFSMRDPHGHSAAAAAAIDSEDNSYISIGSLPLARDHWKSNSDSLDIMSIYLPGTDNAGHTFGQAYLDHQPTPKGPDDYELDDEKVGLPIEGAQLVDVINPPAVLLQHASQVLDDALGKLIRKIEEQGMQNTVLFAMTADHGQHSFRNTREFVLLTEDVKPLFEVAVEHGGMGMEFWDGGNYDDAQAVYSPNGAFGQFYLRDEGKTWQQPPDKEDVMKLAWLLYSESKGHQYVGEPYQLVCEMAKRKIVGSEPYAGCKEFVHSVKNLTIEWQVAKSDGIYGATPAIFVRVSDTGGNHFMEDYRWFKVERTENETVEGEPVTYRFETSLESIDEFIAVSGKGPTQWPAFKERIAELNHKNYFGSRSGDVITVLNGEQGHLSVNNTGEVYAGWHGGPTRSESEVPLFFAVLGNGFTDSQGRTLLQPPELISGYNKGKQASNIKGDGYLRNWHLAHVLKKVIKEFRDE